MRCGVTLWAGVGALGSNPARERPKSVSVVRNGKLSKYVLMNFRHTAIPRTGLPSPLR